MKKLILSILTCLWYSVLTAQNPMGFNYQAVARDGAGDPIPNRNLPVRISIQSDSLGGTLFWQEEHSSASTNGYGVINIVVGKGSKVAGTVTSFENIDWSVTPKFIKTEINDGAWKSMGTSRMWSVPYSLVSEEARGVAAGSKVAIVSEDDASTDALFEVKRKDGQTVFAVYNDAVNVYIPDQSKRPKGGFAVGGFGYIKGFSQQYLSVTPDSIRMYIDDVSPKGTASKGGFAVGGFDQTKGIARKYLSLSGSNSVDTLTNASQILWYPRKEAFIAGRIDIMHPDSVGINSFSTGFRNMAIGDFSHAMGYQAIARGNYSTAIGRRAIAGNNSFALGNFSSALGDDSYALGSRSVASGDTSFALGVGAHSRGLCSVSLGYQSMATDSFAVAIGYFSKATRKTAHSFGLNAEASAIGSLALGMYSRATADFSTSLGFHSVANQQYSTAIGYHAFASGPDSYAIGSHAEANGPKSFAIGSFGLNENGTVNESRSTWTPGYCALAFGMGAQATKIGSMSLGVNTTASGDQSLAIGFGTNATNQFATAMGFRASANGLKSIAIGSYYNVTFNQLVWEWNTTLGKWVITTVPTLIDKQTIADGDYSISLGNGNYSNNGGMSLGTNNNSTAYGSVTIGHSNQAISDFSFAAGFDNYIDGLKSFALGEHLRAKSANCFVIGAYNKIEGTIDSWLDNEPLFVIGNGNPTIRSNAFAVTKNGNIILSPNLETGSGVPLIYDPADNLLKKQSSSAAYKTAIEPLTDINWLYKLNPVSFIYASDKSGRTQYGLTAEETETVNSSLVIYSEGKPEAINYNSLIAPVIRAIQEQKSILDNLDTRNEILEKENIELKERINKLEEIIFSLPVEARQKDGCKN
jgi:hypothetical protein